MNLHLCLMLTCLILNICGLPVFTFFWLVNSYILYALLADTFVVFIEICYVLLMLLQVHLHKFELHVSVVFFENHGCDEFWNDMIRCGIFCSVSFRNVSVMRLDAFEGIDANNMLYECCRCCKLTFELVPLMRSRFWERECELRQEPFVI